MYTKRIISFVIKCDYGSDDNSNILLSKIYLILGDSPTFSIKRNAINLYKFYIFDVSESVEYIYL